MLCRVTGLIVQGSLILGLHAGPLLTEMQRPRFLLSDVIDDRPRGHHSALHDIRYLQMPPCLNFTVSATDICFAGGRGGLLFI